MKFSFNAAILAVAINASEIESLQYAAVEESYDSACPDLKHLENLDTPGYQAQSAYCKQ